MYEVHILFRNGSEVCINCDECTVTKDNRNNKIEKIDYTVRKTKNSLLWIDFDEILCVYAK